uniref:Triadin n=1 Tax=Periophthalmus magnuspinnatus TaxID=409849 RepID=A0A3B3ZA52_9GOBI
MYFDFQITVPMGSQTKDSDSAPQSPQRTFMEDLIVTFSSPMAWLLMIALIITWAGVAIVLFDLLDYTTLAGTSSELDSYICHFTIHFIILPFSNDITEVPIVL